MELKLDSLFYYIKALGSENVDCFVEQRMGVLALWDDQGIVG